MNEMEAVRRRQLDNHLSYCINILHTIKNQHNLTDDDRIRALKSIQESIPDMIRLYIFFKNTKAGN